MAYDDFEDKSFKVDDNYFKVVIPDLDPGKSVPVQFRWQYADQSYGAWSVSKILEVPEISRPEATNIVATWVQIETGIALQIVWDAPELTNGFAVYLTSPAQPNNIAVFTQSRDKNSTSQKIIIPIQWIKDNFAGVFVTTLNGVLKSIYIDNATTGQTFTIPVYNDPLQGSVIPDNSWKITQVDKGFSVSWDAVPTVGTTYWETVVETSANSTGPFVARGSARNAPVFVGELNQVWVRISHRLITGGYSQYSNAKSAEPYVPIIFDETPPNEVTVNSATWSGTDLIINYTMPATDPGARFEVILSKVVSGVTKTGRFSDFFPAQTGTHNFIIKGYGTERASLQSQFGKLYDSFTGKFISIDAAENPTNGTTFSTTTMPNPGTGVVPTFTTIGALNGYTVSWTQPDWALYTYVYQSDVSGFTPSPTNRVYTGNSPAIISTFSNISPFARKYIKIFYVTDIDDGSGGYKTSDSSAEGFVDPINPDTTDTTPPPNATATAAWNGNNVEITPTFPSGDDSVRCIIELTANSQTRPFLRWKAELVSGKFIITQDQMYASFGAHYTSFTGNFKTADAAGNINTGTTFNVASKTNPLTGVIPTFIPTAITNGYTLTWTLPSLASYAKVYESATSWGAGNPTESDLVFSGQSPAIIKKTVYTTRYIKIKYLTIDGFESSWSAESTVTPIDAIAADTNPPNAPSVNLTATSSIDNTGVMGFNGVINLSWNAVSDPSLRGYRIRFRPVTTPESQYSYVDAPAGTSYRLGGLAVGATYEIGIASYDEFNNTTTAYSSFVNQTISGTPAMSNYITAGAAGFQFGSGIKDKTGSQNASAQGIYLSNSNYWYLTSSNSAEFKIGGSTNNYVQWNGTKLTVDGDLGVAGGTTIGGNIAMGTSGASIYQGTLTGGALTSDGFILNSGGLSIKKGSVNLRLDTSDGGIYAQYGQVAGWTIDSSKIERLTSAKYTGISSSGAYAFYAGAGGTGNSGGDSGAEFWVKPDGSVKANNISITGGTLKVGSNFDVTAAGVLTATNGKFNGEITAASGTITGNLNVTSGSIITGAATSGVNRVVMSPGGLFGYKNTGGVDTINFSFPNDTGLFKLGTGEISGWTVDNGKIEKATSTTINGVTADTYAGISTGSLAFYAGAGVGGSGTPQFSVSQAGAVTARNISIIGTGSAGSNVISVGSSFYIRQDGYLYSTSGGRFDGEINAASGVIRGVLDVGTAGVYNGQLRITSSGGTILMGHGVTINGASAAGITATASGGATNFWVRASDGYMFSQSGQIGGWTIGTSDLKSGAGATTVALSSSGTYAMWAGAGSAFDGTNYAPFSVTNAGQLRATGAIISGQITVSSGRIGNQTNGWNINAGQLESFGTPSGSTQLILNSLTGSITGGLISGTSVVGSAFYIGANTSATDFIKSDGTFTLGGGKVTYAGGTLTIQNTNLKLNITSNEDGTFGDSTVVIDEQTGFLTTGRALFYGGLTDPRTGNGGFPVTTRGQVAAGAQGSAAFVKGDLWLQRA